jgi:hypothetical protein
MNRFLERTTGLLAAWLLLTLATAMLIFSPALFLMFWWIAPLTVGYCLLFLVSFYVLLTPLSGFPDPLSPAPLTPPPVAGPPTVRPPPG